MTAQAPRPAPSGPKPPAPPPPPHIYKTTGVSVDVRGVIYHGIPEPIADEISRLRAIASRAKQERKRA